jgi:hypothetical protein
MVDSVIISDDTHTVWHIGHHTSSVYSLGITEIKANKIHYFNLMNITEDVEYPVLATRLFRHRFKCFIVAVSLFCHLSNRHETFAPVARNEL